MPHLIIDLAKIGLIVMASAIAISAFFDTFGTAYDPYADEFYTPLADEDEE